MKKGNLNRIISDEVGVSVRAEIKDYTLFIRSNSQEDFEKICSSEHHPYAKLARRVLENKNCSVILTKIKYNEVDGFLGVQNQLRHVGIMEWEPLSKNKPNSRGIKCKCKSRENLKAILKEFYLSGMKVRLNDQTII